MHLVHNERTKLTATWFNNLSVALAAVGSFVPFLGSLTVLLGEKDHLSPSSARVTVQVFLAWMLALILRLMALRVLNRLREEEGPQPSVGAAVYRLFFTADVVRMARLFPAFSIAAGWPPTFAARMLNEAFGAIALGGAEHQVNNSAAVGPWWSGHPSA